MLYSLCKSEIEKVHDDRGNTLLSVGKGKSGSIIITFIMVFTADLFHIKLYSIINIWRVRGDLFLCSRIQIRGVS